VAVKARNRQAALFLFVQGNLICSKQQNGSKKWQQKESPGSFANLRTHRGILKQFRAYSGDKYTDNLELQKKIREKS